MPRTRVLSRAAAAGAVAAMVVASACYQPPPEVLVLDSGTLTVTNHSKRDWSNVEVWLNTYYRATFASIPAGGRMQAPLNYFVAGLGQRFNYAKMQVHDLRLTAKLPDGSPLEVKKQFEIDGLAGVAREMDKKK